MTEVLRVGTEAKKTYRHKLAILDQQLRQVMVGYDTLVRRLLYGLFSDGQKTRRTRVSQPTIYAAIRRADSQG